MAARTLAGCLALSAGALACAAAGDDGCDYERLGCDLAVWIHFRAEDPEAVWRDGRWRVEVRAEGLEGGCEAVIDGWGGCVRDAGLRVALYVANGLGGTPVGWIAISQPVPALHFEVFREETPVVSGDVVPTFVPPLPEGDRCPTECVYADIDFPVETLPRP